MESKNNKHIGDKIRQLRNKKGLTQDALAKKADIPYTTLTKIEANVITKPSIQSVVKIAAGLNVTIDELLNSK
ncbi:TPA: hypothetical protein DDZ10_01240 [Candidatus Uhrbacteria bacterium]|nr:hypothetical protein [Candidatus Uhrbacteria bacterium]